MHRLKRRLAPLSMLPLLALPLLAQEGATNTADGREALCCYAAYVAYQLKDPGFAVGVEGPLARSRGFTVLVGGSFQLVAQAGIQTGLALAAHYGLRYTTPIGIYFENLLGAGYEHVLYTQTTWDIQGTTAQRVDTPRFAPSFAPRVALGLGYDFRSKTRLPLLLYARAALGWRIPDRNALLQNAFALEAGLMVSPGWRRR